MAEVASSERSSGRKSAWRRGAGAFIVRSIATESATPSTDAATSVSREVIAHWIDGAPLLVADSKLSPVYDPASGQIARSAQLADRAIVDLAVASSVKAGAEWRALALSRRTPILHELRAQLIARKDELVAAISAEHGKVPDDAAGEIQRGLEIVELACSAPQLLKGEFSEQVAGDIDTFSLRQPLGVCVGITPFNFPVMVPLWMFPVALACGNTFVLKPSERDPSASLILAEIARDAGVPAGVLNVVQGDSGAVQDLIDHPDVAAVSFVGSTAVARAVYERAAARGKRVQALGGAKNHVVVMPDADLRLAANGVVSAAFGSTGQRCMAISVLVAVGGVGDRLAGEIGTLLDDLSVGGAGDDGAEMGPLVTADARNRVLDYVERGVDGGAELVRDGRAGSHVDREGFFVGPTVFDEVVPGMDIYDDEIFGPLLSIVRVESLDAALALIAENRYGNGASIYTASGAAARRFQHDVEAGMVGINVPIPVPVGYYSFGGWGESLFGDTHIYGPEGFHFYTRGKVVTSRWPEDEQTRPVDLAFPQG